MIRAVQSRRERCRALTSSRQRVCGNRARYRLVWTFALPTWKPATMLSHSDVCGKHYRPMTRQLEAHGIIVALKMFGRVRA